MKVAFLGLGVMGYSMAGHLQNAGFDVIVFNRTLSKADEWISEYKGSQAATPAEAAKNADVVCVCVGNDESVREVILGKSGALESLAPDSLLIDHTTTSAELAREIAAHAKKKNIHFIDAPISGGQAGAENGMLTVMVGGDEREFLRAQPIFEAYARCSVLIGPVGSGQLCKMVNQICIAGIVQGLSEGLHFAQQADLDCEKVVMAISQGAAGSWQMNNRYKTMLNNEFKFGFAVDWMRKDLGYALSEARKNRSHLPITSLIDQFYSEIQALGGSKFDTSSLIYRLNRKDK